MINKRVWDTYRSQGTIKSDSRLQLMISQVVDIIHNLEDMYGVVGSQLVVRSLLQEWISLSQMAQSRGIPYERP
jgi:hypothetical protein